MISPIVSGHEYIMSFRAVSSTQPRVCLSVPSTNQHLINIWIAYRIAPMIGSWSPISRKTSAARRPLLKLLQPLIENESAPVTQTRTAVFLIDVSTHAETVFSLSGSCFAYHDRVARAKSAKYLASGLCPLVWASFIFNSVRLDAGDNPDHYPILVDQVHSLLILSPNKPESSVNFMFVSSATRPVPVSTSPTGLLCRISVMY